MARNWNGIGFVDPAGTLISFAEAFQVILKSREIGIRVLISLSGEGATSDHRRLGRFFSQPRGLIKARKIKARDAVKSG